ncbi:MAG: hypothetical protein ACLQJF_23785 [Candidatus Sulfotelmatobacter sp.]|jgi:hypothetical protein
MTIAAAFYCTDGVVVCADTSEESTYTKRDQTKIRQIKNDSETYVFTGAGDADLLEIAIDDIIESRRRRKRKSASEWKAELKKDAAHIFKDYVQPCAGLEDRAPSMDLIASVQVDGWISLFRIRENLVRKIKPLEHVAVGFGRVLAVSLMDQYAKNANLTMDATACLGSYLLERVARYVPRVGGRIDFCKQGVDGTLIPGSATNWQTAIEGLNLTTRSLIHAALEEHDSGFDAATKKLVQQLNSVRAAFKVSTSLRVFEQFIENIGPSTPSTSRKSRRAR